MKLRNLGLLMSVLSFASVSFAEECKMPKPTVNARFKALSQLAGDWVGHEVGDATGQSIDLSYSLSSNGTILVEKMPLGTPMEMTSVYHSDGKQVLMTHYCAMGNQPRMKSVNNDPQMFRFEFVDGANIKSANDAHMHEVLLTRLDKNHLRQDWTFYQDGKAGGTKSFVFARK